MHRKRAVALGVSIAAVGLPGLALPAPSQAATPSVTGVDCVRGCVDGLPRGNSVIEVRGRNLSLVSRALFAGGGSRVATLSRRAGTATSARVRVRLPWETVSGTFVLGTRDGRVTSPERLRIAPVPVIARLRCIKRCGGGVRPGSIVQARGVRLENVRSAEVSGVSARVGRQTSRSFRMRVPAGAKSGRVTAVEADGDRSPARPFEVAPPPPEAIFPVRGPHDFGGSGAQFGAGRGGRSHQGHDVFASCGTPLVAAAAGRVQYAGYQSAAGHYMVIDSAKPNLDMAYMHLVRAPRHRVGQRVVAGERIGEVGDSGNAQGCHLHFELWTSPGWYEGGRPVDPLPYLRAWKR